MILSEDEILATAKAIPAVYQITNLINGKFYIGSTINYRDRRTRHFYELRHNKHGNARLQHAFNKYGAENFKIEMLTPVTPDELLFMEQCFIDWSKAADRNIGYNISPIASRPDNRGSRRTEEQKRRMSESQRGKKRTPEARLNMSIAQKKLFASGYVHPNKGKTFTPEEKEKHRIAMRRKWKPVVQMTLDGQDVATYFYINAAQEVTGIWATQIIKCCRGTYKTAGGFKWKWAA